MTHRLGLAFEIFPFKHSKNVTIAVNGVGSEKPFTPFASNELMNLSFYGGGSLTCSPKILPTEMIGWWSKGARYGTETSYRRADHRDLASS
jgi:predicted helicase